MVDNPRVVEGRFFDCPEGLVVTADCLGQTYKTVIGKQPLAVTLPSLPDMTDANDTLPLLVAPERHYEYPPRPDNLEPIGWGLVTYARGGVPQSAVVGELHYTFEIGGNVSDVSETCVRIEGDLASWWERMSMWLDTSTELDLLKHGHRGVAGLGKSFLAYTRYDDGTVRAVNWMSKSSMPFPRMIEVPDPATLSRCFDLAGAGAVLPAEWQYIRDARSWLNAGQTRRAVLDACTAAEIALANQVHHLLGTTDEVVIEELLLRCNGIADVAKLVRRVGGPDATASRKQVEERLAKVRNRAAHGGYEPDHEEASQALKAAIDVVERYLPRDSLYERATLGTFKGASAPVIDPLTVTHPH
jgi:hypothetical protein